VSGGVANGGKLTERRGDRRSANIILWGAGGGGRYSWVCQGQRGALSPPEELSLWQEERAFS